MSENPSLVDSFKTTDQQRCVRVLIVGHTGAGKSSLCRMLLQQFAKDRTPGKQEIDGGKVDAPQNDARRDLFVIDGLDEDTQQEMFQVLDKARRNRKSATTRETVISTRENGSFTQSSENNSFFLKSSTCLPKGKHIEDFKKELLKTDENQRNAAHRAAVSGNLWELQYMLDNLGIPADAKSSSNLTLLHLAAMFRKEQVALYLCKRYPFLIPEADVIDRTALHIAAQKGSLVIVRTLLEHGADVYTPAGDGSTMLHIAASLEDTSILNYLCENFHFNHLNVSNKIGTFPIHYAARVSLGNVKLLIEKGEMPDARTSDGKTIAHMAAYHGRMDILEYILETHKGLLEMTDNAGRSPAHHAAIKGQVGVLKYILEIRSVPLVSTAGWTPATVAVRYGQRETLEFLYECHRSLVRRTDVARMTMGHHAAATGQTECLEYLCQVKLVNSLATDLDGSTILHAAARNGKEATLKWIIARFPGIVNRRDTEGKTALDRARFHGYDKCVTILSSP